jgi:hypothetical protein
LGGSTGELGSAAEGGDSANGEGEKTQASIEEEKAGDLNKSGVVNQNRDSFLEDYKEKLKRWAESIDTYRLQDGAMLKKDQDEEENQVKLLEDE